VVGLYELVDPAAPYWADPSYAAPSDSTAAASRTDPVFVPMDTFAPGGFDSPQFAADIELPLDAFRQADLGARIARAQYALGENGLQVGVGATDVLNHITQDHDLINNGVLVGAAQLLVLSWFALYLAGRFTGADRRRDVGLLKLRGATFGRLLRLVAGQNAAPILAGSVLGVGLGYLIARLSAGSVDGPGRAALAWQLSAGAVALAVAGSLLAIIASEWGTLRAPVADLLRRVPPRTGSPGAGSTGAGRGAGWPRWRAGAADLVVVVLALAGAYQVRAQGGVSGAAPGLALLAPTLVALAVALLLARTLSYLAGRAGGAALSAGRLRLGLGALQVARRPGTERVFALLAVAVAVLATAAMGAQSSGQARQSRALVEVGADRQLTVQASSRAQLLHAVRAADPAGRYAMAVVYNNSKAAGSPPVLAVDASRLARVASWQPGYGIDPATLAARLRPAAPAPLRFAGSGVTLDAALTQGNSPTVVVMDLTNQATGTAVRLAFGPLRSGRDTYRAASPGCANGGCRLVSLALAGQVNRAGNYPAAAPGTAVAMSAIGQQGPDAQVAGAATLGDVRRWHGPLTASAAATLFTAGDGVLTVTAAGGQPGVVPSAGADQRIYPVDATLPLPGVLAGVVPGDWQVGDPTLAPFGVDQVPVRVAGTVPALPELGGNGIVVDLETAGRVASEVTIGDQDQVWLARDAPAGVVAGLRANGLTILDGDSVSADLTRLGTAGLTAALRFQLLTAIVGVLLGAAAVTVAGAVERQPRAAELAALRAQGLAGRDARLIGYGGWAVLVGLAVLAGVLGAVLARFLAGSGLPVFADFWAVVPSPSGLRPLSLLLSAAAAAVLLGAVGLAAGYQLDRAVRTGGTR
jgi:hypothetical protein